MFPHSYRYLDVQYHGKGVTARLRKLRMDETEINAFAEELNHLIAHGGCPRVALVLGPEAPLCMFSVFLAKLITSQRLAQEHGGELTICGASPNVLDIFDACKISDRFHFVPDVATALARWEE